MQPSIAAPHVSIRVERLSAIEERVNIARRSLFSLPLALSPLLAMPAWAATDIRSARVWPANEYTRVTFESAGALKHKYFFVKDPERLVLDLENVDLGNALKELAAKIGGDDPFIKSLRVGVNRPGVIRVVLDLKTEVAPQVFAVPPAGEFGHRLMLDIYPSKPADPLLALMNDDAASFVNGAPTVPTDATIARAGSELPPVAQAAPTAPTQPATPTVAAKKPESPAIIAGKKQPRPFVVVLDPGHGGEDPGAIGRRGTREKDVVLTISRLIKDKLDGDRQYRIALTRDADFFVPLHHRVQRARRLKADLFVSVHADAFVQSQAHGSSVFALSERGATSTAARWLATRENDADLIGGVNLNVRDTNLARVLIDLSTTAQINDSLKLGKLVLGELGEINRLHKSQVEQAGFAVLKAPDIPSILVETAFISNPDEERKLRDPAFQEKFADAIAEGMRIYFRKNPALARA